MLLGNQFSTPFYTHEKKIYQPMEYLKAQALRCLSLQCNVKRNKILSDDHHCILTQKTSIFLSLDIKGVFASSFGLGVPASQLDPTAGVRFAT